jgi:hypothetical protein
MDEAEFQSWYADRAKRQGLNPNPDDPQHFYDYRAAHAAGAEPDATGHWPSKFKLEGHPRMVLNGVNTKTGEHVADPTVLANSLRNFPKDATVGSVEYAPPTLEEKIAGSGPRSALAAAATMLPMGVGGLAARAMRDRRVNAMFDPAAKQFWKMFGKRAVD